MSHANATRKSVLPQPYRTLFMIIEPGVILAALLSILIDPDSHFQSMGPDQCSAASPDAITGTTLPQGSHECMTPRIRALQLYFMAALAFSAFIEPAVLYVAAYKLQNAQDSRMVVTAVLASFAAFDVFHAVAAVAGSGINAVLPKGAEFDVLVAVNFWVPLGWLVVRGCWFFGEGTKQKEG